MSVSTPSRRQILTGGAVAVAGGLVSVSELSRGPTDGERSVTGAKILALGDSYTVGTSVDPDARWISTLGERLREDGVAVADPTVIAEAGWTTMDLDGAIRAETPAETYDLVTLLIGANNAFQGRDPGEFQSEFAALLNRSVRFAGGEATNVIAMTIPDYSLTPVGQQFEPDVHADRIDTYNRRLRAVVAKRDTRLVDLVPVSRAVSDDPELVSDDGLHPSPKQHDRWLERIYPVAKAAVSR